MAHTEEERAALGARLAIARKAAGHTLESAAWELTERGHPIGKAAVGAWEKGRNVPDALWLRRLASLYGKTLDGLAWPEVAAWPFSPDLYEPVQRLSTDGLAQLDGILRGYLSTLPGSLQKVPEQLIRQQTDSSAVGTNPAGRKNSVVLPGQIIQGANQNASRQSGAVQKQRSGRNPKRAA